jgi:hypothetical protein
MCSFMHLKTWLTLYPETDSKVGVQKFRLIMCLENMSIAAATNEGEYFEGISKKKHKNKDSKYKINKTHF